MKFSTSRVLLPARLRYSASEEKAPVPAALPGPAGCGTACAARSCSPAGPAVLGRETPPGLRAAGRDPPHTHTLELPHWVATSTFSASVKKRSVCDQASHLVPRVTCSLLRARCAVPWDRAVGVLFSPSEAQKLDTFSWRWFSSLAKVLLGCIPTLRVWELLGASLLAEPEITLVWCAFKASSFQYFFFLYVSSASGCLNRIVQL